MSFSLDQRLKSDISAYHMCDFMTEGLWHIFYFDMLVFALAIKAMNKAEMQLSFLSFSCCEVSQMVSDAQLLFAGS